MKPRWTKWVFMNKTAEAPRSTRIWHTVTVTVDEKATEAIEFAMNSLCSIGTEINLPCHPDDRPRTVIGYFDFLPEDEDLRNEITRSLSVYGLEGRRVHDVTRGIIEETDWLSEWKKHWKPTYVGGFVIAPPWENIEASDSILIKIEPNMAFGTGTHETTRLCLAAIGENYSAGDSFLDVGTGTGILAIAAARLAPGEPPGSEKCEAAVRILAVDVDPDSVKIARENAELNGVSDRIEFRQGSIDGLLEKFDFVCANLTADVIIPMLPLLPAAANRFLVLSGILTEQQNSVISALNGFGIKDFSIQRLGEWISVKIFIPSNN